MEDKEVTMREKGAVLLSFQAKNCVASAPLCDDLMFLDRKWSEQLGAGGRERVCGGEARRSGEGTHTDTRTCTQGFIIIITRLTHQGRPYETHMARQFFGQRGRAARRRHLVVCVWVLCVSKV